MICINRVTISKALGVFFSQPSALLSPVMEAQQCADVTIEAYVWDLVYAYAHQGIQGSPANKVLTNI